MEMCKRMNLKLSPVKFKISDCVKFGGTVISSKRLRDGNVIFMDPPDKRVVAVTEMPEPQTTKEVRVFMGMISSLSSWFPNISFNTPNLRAACAENKKFQWNEILQKEFLQVKHVFKSQIRLSPLDPNKTPKNTPNNTPNKTPNNTPNITPNNPPDNTPNNIPNTIPNNSTNNTPNKTPNKTP